MKNKIRKPLIKISIALLILLIISYFIYLLNKDEINKNWIKLDANSIIYNVKSQYRLDKLNNEEANCYYIHGLNPEDYKYYNAGNYIGSVYIDEDKIEIWLSDGNYILEGTEDNLEIYKSSLSATQNCNQY